MAKIQGIWTRETLNAIGNPTLECTLWLDTGGIVATSVATDPSFESKIQGFPRDKDPNRFQGEGLKTVVQLINSQVAPNLINQDPTNQEGIDQLLEQYEKQIGASGSLALSQAVLKAGALASNLPTYAYLQQKYQFTPQLKIPAAIYTLIAGGEFGTHNLDIQEFQIIAASHLAFSDSLGMASTIFNQLQKILISKKSVPAVNTLGAVTPNLYSNNDAFELLLESAKTTQYVFSQDFFFGINVMADNLFVGGKYQFRERQEGYLPDELLVYYKSIQETYQILCMENPFAESDKKLAAALMAEISQITKIGGNIDPKNLHKIAAQNIYNILMVKPNNFNSINNLMGYIAAIKQLGLPIIIVQAWGETNDDLLADLAVGTGANYVQFGPTNRGERITKYNRLLMIEDELKRSQQPT